MVIASRAVVRTDLLAVPLVPTEVLVLLEILTVIPWRFRARHRHAVVLAVRPGVDVARADGALVLRLQALDEALLALVVDDAVPVDGVHETQGGVLVDANGAVGDVCEGVQTDFLQAGHLEYHERIRKEQVLTADHR